MADFLRSIQKRLIPDRKQTPKLDLNQLCGSGQITKQVFQCARQAPPPHVTAMLERRLPKEWQYLHFDDSQIIDYFQSHPLDEFPKITRQFHYLKCGAHKADLFRYYYLFINGGLFIDSDAMIYGNVNPYLEKFSFLSVDSDAYPGALFQGILAACPRNPIIYLALHDAYYTENRTLRRDYHHLCRRLYDFFHASPNKNNGLLFREERDTPGGFDRILDDQNEVLFKHFWRDKVVPEEL